MEYIKTQVEDLKLSRVGLGTWAIGGANWGETNVDEAIRTIHKAVDMGITVIDTAPIYGCGHSEEVVGKALADGGRRNKVVLATKCGLSWDENGNAYRDCRPETIRKEVELSLKRLKTDHIDIYQIHWADIKVPFAETAGTMQELINEGKIRAIGVSNMSNAQMDEWRKTAPIHTLQPSYNILENKLFEDQIPYCLENDINVISYSSLCRGLLSGKYYVGMKFREGDMRNEEDPKFQGENFKNHIAAVDELKEYAKQFGKSVSELAVRWVLDKGVSCALWGARTPEQLDNIPGVMGWSLTKEQCQEMEDIVAKHVPVQVGKEFLTPPYRED